MVHQVHGGKVQGKMRAARSDWVLGYFAFARGPLIQLSGCQAAVSISSGISSWHSAARLCPRERWGPIKEHVNPPWSQQTGCTAGPGSVCQCRCAARSQQLAQPAWPQQMLLLALSLASPLSLGALLTYGHQHCLDLVVWGWGWVIISLLSIFYTFILGVSSLQKQ